MITKIIAQLKTGVVKNVVEFGMGSLPSPPYVVVKPEKNDSGRTFRIIAHFSPGQQLYLEDYIFGDVSDLLDGFTATTRHGNYNILKTLNEYTDIVTNNDDGTISMERSFLMPSRLF